MGNKTWKKIETSDGFRRVKLRLKQIIGKEPKFTVDVKLNLKSCAGWDLVSELIKPDDVVYSFGICDDIDFELELIRSNMTTVFAFDPTPFSVDWIGQQDLPAAFHFYPWAASGTDGEFFLYPRVNKKGEKSIGMYTFHSHEESRNDGIRVKAYTVSSAAEKLNHQSIDVLKMDVEGAEYDVLDGLVKSELRPKMILVEFHHRFKGVGKQKTIDIVNALRSAGYLIASISVTGREFCFVHGSVAV